MVSIGKSKMLRRKAYSATLVIVGILTSLTKCASAFTLNTAIATKPPCDPREPCRVGFVGLEFCSCPNNQNCPNSPSHTLNYENIDYHFCQPTTVQACQDGEVAWIRRGLRHTIHCTCPAPLRLTSEVWDTKTDTTEYKCSQQRQCQSSDDVCMVRNRVLVSDRMVSLLKGLCQCPDGKQCMETGQIVANQSSTDLQQDIFKCSVPASQVIVDAAIRTPLDDGMEDEEYLEEERKK